MSSKLGGVVAAGHPLTAAAGVEMLRLGGNGFDAAIAAVMTSCVTESVLTSVAGGGFLLAHTSTGDNVLYDFFSQTPRQKALNGPPHFYPIEANFGDTVQEFHIGLGSMAVPSNLAGLVHVHRRHGRLPLSVVLEPAIHRAREGVVLDEFRAYCLNLLAPILTATPAARRLYAPEGRLLTLGETLTMGDFANALEYLIQAGPEDFYQGDMARQIVKDCAEQGGYLTLEDLQSYRVVERRPLQIQYRGTTLLTNPPPSSGGTLIAFALQLLATIDLAAYPHGSPEHLQILAQVMRLTNEARRDGLDANLYQPTIAEWFLGPDHVSPYQQALQSSVNKWGSTTQVSVIDTEGNAVSITSSNGEGSSYIIPGTDIMVNNMLGEEDLNPYGFHQWQPNQRISSMMAPTIVLQNHQPELALGSGGSNRIRTAILQVISNVVDFHLPIAEAVMAPRIHWERGAFHLEPGYDREGLTPLLSQTPDELVWWQQQNMFFGGVHGVCRQADGSLMGAGDSRRGGAVAAYFP